jgi:hypothetical protein
MKLLPQNAGFSEPKQLTQRKSERLIEGFVCNPLFDAVPGKGQFTADYFSTI